MALLFGFLTVVKELKRLMKSFAVEQIPTNRKLELFSSVKEQPHKFNAI